MGWTEYRASFYTKSGAVDRKAECDYYFTGGLNAGFYHLKKSVMKGSTYYAAVEVLKRYAGKDESGKAIYEEIPEDERKTHCEVFLTSVSGASFAYKDMDETMGPCEAECPLSILSLLSPTENECALAWRQRCREYAAKPKTGKLPLGTVIEFEIRGKTYRATKRAPAYQFKSAWWETEGGYIKKKNIPEDFRVIDRLA